MNPGELRNRITFRIPQSQTIDGLDQVVYVNGDTFWAAVVPLKGREFWEAQSVQAESIVKVKMRYVAGVDKRWKIRFEGTDYSIIDIIDVDMRHRELLIYCKVVE